LWITTIWFVRASPGARAPFAKIRGRTGGVVPTPAALHREGARFARLLVRPAIGDKRVSELAGSDKHIHLLTETRADEFGDDPDCELARLADELSDIA
jgi:hypothetical protein